MKLLDVAIDALATQRITRLITEDVITEDIRDVITSKYPPQEHKLGYLVTCPHCVSVWAGGAVTLMRMAGENPTSRPTGVFRCTLGVLRYTLALSGVVSLGNEIAAKLPDQL